MVWVGVVVERISPDSGLPAYAVCAELTPGPAFIGRVMLHSTGDGPNSSWKPSMSHEDVGEMVDHLSGLLDAGAQLVSWGGLRTFLLFNQYELSAVRQQRLGRIVRSHFDLQTAWYFGLRSGDDVAEAPSSPAGDTPFPFGEWLSGVRSSQMGAVQFSIDTLANLSEIFHGIDAVYFEDGRSVSVSALCDPAHVTTTFGHAQPVARRLSETLQDEVSLIL